MGTTMAATLLVGPAGVSSIILGDIEGSIEKLLVLLIITSGLLVDGEGGKEERGASEEDSNNDEDINEDDTNEVNTKTELLITGEDEVTTGIDVLDIPNN